MTGAPEARGASGPPRAAGEGRLLGVLTAIFATVLVLVPAASSKIFALGPLRLPGGTVVFPLVFILNDLLTEVYGYAAARRVLWIGCGCQLFAVATYLVVGALPPAPYWPHQDAYDRILGFAPRVALASVVAHLCGEFANSFVLSRMKYRQGGERGAKQGWRFLASTIVGEAVDSVAFVTVAYAGTIPSGEVARTVVVLYGVKVAYEAVVLPLTTRLAEALKRADGIDRIDRPAETNYSPFAFFRSRRGTPAGRA